MLFEMKSLCVVVPLEPVEGSHYTKPVHNYEDNDDDLDQIYKITTWDQDWVNPTTDGWISWDRESSCTSYSDEELEHLQIRLHEVSTLRYNIMTKSLHCVSSQIRSLPYYDGLTNVDKFMDAFER